MRRFNRAIRYLAGMALLPLLAVTAFLALLAGGAVVCVLAGLDWVFGYKAE